VYVDSGLISDLLQPGKVTIFTDLRSYGTSQPAKGTVHNGTAHSIFLPGCAIFSRDLLEGGKWVNKGPAVLCGWEGNAVEVLPGQGQSQEVSFGTLGSWRLTLEYGIGCKRGVPLSAAKCASMGKAISPAVKVFTDKATCETINKQYKNQLAQAKKCNSYLNIPQCSKIVNGDLSCGCPLYVHDTSPLKSSMDKWSSLGCSKVMPPCGIKCPPAPKASCINGTCMAVMPHF